MRGLHAGVFRTAGLLFLNIPVLIAVIRDPVVVPSLIQCYPQSIAITVPNFGGGDEGARWIELEHPFLFDSAFTFLFLVTENEESSRVIQRYSNDSRESSKIGTHKGPVHCRRPVEHPVVSPRGDQVAVGVVFPDHS